MASVAHASGAKQEAETCITAPTKRTREDEHMLSGRRAEWGEKMAKLRKNLRPDQESGNHNK